MDKKYSVDDILSEIHRTKQRREEPSSNRYSVEERYRQYLQQERSEPPASQPKEERREEKPIRFSNAVHREEPLREQESAPRPRKEAPIAAEEKSFFQTSVSVEREEQPILQKAQEEDPFVRTSFDRESFQSFFGQGGAVDEKEERRKEKMRLKEEKKAQKKQKRSQKDEETETLKKKENFKEELQTPQEAFSFLQDPADVQRSITAKREQNDFSQDIRRKQYEEIAQQETRTTEEVIASVFDEKMREKEENKAVPPAVSDTLDNTRIDIMNSLREEEEEGFSVSSPQAPGDATRLSMAFQQRMQREDSEKKKEKILHPAEFLNPQMEEEEEKEKETVPKKDEIDEYASPQETKDVYEDLCSLQSSICLRFLLSAVGFLGGLYVAFAAVLGLPFGDLLDRALQPESFVAAQLVLLGVVMVINFSAIIAGLSCLFSRKCNSDSMTALTTIVVLIHTLVCLFFPLAIAQNELHVYPLLASFALLLNAGGKWVKIRRILRNFRFVSSDNRRYSVKTVDSEPLAWEIAKGLEIDEPEIAYNVRSKFATSFLEYSYSEDPIDVFSRLLLPIAVCGAVVVAVFSYILTKSWLSAFTAFTMVLVAACPACCLLAGNLPLGKTSKTLRRFGAALPGARSLEDFSDTNVLIVNAQDLFPEGTIVLHGIKTFGTGRIDEAILDAASVILKLGGTLADVFNQVIVGKQDILHPVDTIVYEDMMGVSAWVDQKRVLIGNRELMRHHGIDAPTKDYEARYRKDGRDLIYLANSGEITAMFVVSYTARDDIDETLYALQKEGVQLVVHTTDPNVTAQKIAATFDVDETMIRILPAKLQGDVLPLCRPKARESSSMCHTGTFTAFGRAILSAIRTSKVYTLCSVLLVLCAAIGYAGVAFFSFISALPQLSPLVLLCYQAVWLAIVALAINMKRL